MRRRIDPDPKLLRLADLQEGVLSREQVLAHGLGRNSVDRLLRHGAWQLLDRGIYLLGTGEPTWPAQVWAGVLIGGDHARVAGTAAAHLHGLADDESDQIQILVPHSVKRRDRSSWVFHRERPGARGPQTVGEPPRLSAEDTVLDLCDPRCVPTDRSAVDWITAAIQRKITTARQLERAVRSRRFVHDRRLILDLLADTSTGAESTLELRYLHDVERAHGLPVGVRQSRRPTAGTEHGRQVFRDVLYEEYQLIIELDGRTGHADVGGRLRDLRRDNVAALRGETTLRYGWQDVAIDSCLTAFQVAGVLTARGWPGPLQSCPRCREVVDPWSWTAHAG